MREQKSAHPKPPVTTPDPELIHLIMVGGTELLAELAHAHAAEEAAERLEATSTRSVLDQGL